MQNRQRRALPFLVTLAGCVMMLAWVDPANATEVTRQLTQKGFAISQLRKTEVAIVKESHNDLKVLFKGFAPVHSVCTFTETTIARCFACNYHVVFPHYVKSLLQDDISTWRKRE